VGGTLQEILQRRGVEKGYGIGVKGALKRVLVFSPLFVLYLGVVFGFSSLEESRYHAPLVYAWFFLSLSSAAFYSYFCFFRRRKRYLRRVADGYVVQTLDPGPGGERRKRYLFETLLSPLILTAGVVHILGLHWLHILFVPVLSSLSLAYRWQIMIPLSLTVPMLEIRHLLYGDRLQESVLSGSAVILAVVISIVATRVRNERDRLRKNIEALKGEVRDIDSGFDSGIIRGDNLIPQHLAATRKANEELQALLSVARQALSADAVSLFDLRKNRLALRCSTEGSRGLLPDERMLALCVSRKTSVIFDAPSDAGGMESMHMATPVAEGKSIAGVLSARKSGSSSEGSFNVQTLEMFSGLVMKLLHNQRVYSHMSREHVGLRLLHEGSSSLTTSLKTDEVARRIVEAAHKIAPFSIALFTPRGEQFELNCEIGFDLKERILDFSNTRIGVVARGTEPQYLSDLKAELKDVRIPVFPFRIGDDGSVFMLPLWYERRLHGILVLFSGKSNALSSYQIELLGLLGNQASTSLANAGFHAEIERMAVTDGLTGLYNHRKFQERLSEEFKRMHRFGKPLSLLLVDIDFFKKINDTRGHPAGDEVLRGVAGIILHNMRNVDTAARYGGEEFAAILPDADHGGAHIMAERLRNAIAEKVFNIDGKELRVAVSIGAATSPHDAGIKEELIEKADQALYHAKRNGRNRCVLWSRIK
jgi:diguanylate cyclase (GGDEF)-like protein